MRVGIVLVCALAACNAPTEPNLSTTEQLSVVVGPPSFNFGSVQIDTSSAPTTFLVSPGGSGESDQTITAIIGCGGFVIDAPGVPGAEVFRHCGTVIEPMMMETVVEAPANCTNPAVRTYSFQASFTPSAVGPASCLGQIVMNNGVQTFGMSGSGVLPPFVVAVSPRSIGFGDIRVGDASDPRTVTISNEGSDDLEVTLDLTTVPEIALTKGTLGAQKILKGTTTKLDFTCTPSSTNNFAATLTIDSNDPVSPRIIVALTCHGINSELDIAPTSFDLPTLVDRPAQASVTLKNEGNTTGKIKSIAFSATTNPEVTFLARPADDSDLAAGATALITIQYSPTAALAQSDLGAVLVQFENDAERVITISGEAKLAKIASDPPTLVFGPVCAGVPTTSSVDVYADEDGSFEVTGATALAPFSVAPLAQSKILTPPGSDRQPFDVTITPAPPAGEVQDVTGMLIVHSDAPGQTDFEIPMVATPLAAGITATSELALGAIVVGDFTAAQPVKFTNCSDGPVMITDQPRFLGDNAADFRLSSQFQPTLVARAETIEIDVVFAPKAAGQRTAELEISFTGGKTSVALVGDGLGALRDRDTYYACSTGGDAAWPLGVVVIVIARRRRRRRR